jgi:hypothetical protein
LASRINGQIMNRLFRPVTCALLFCSLAHFHALPAMAASEEEEQSAAEEASQKAESAKAAKRAAPPSAIPGSEGMDEDDGDRIGKDVEPTTALFEAINRGSVAAAKDAVNRGADLGGHNILGQTPLEMSIDLNRNPITFLLLSLRTSDDRVGAGYANQGMENARPVVTGGINAARMNTGPAGHGYDSTGGIAQPSAGFLGFGGS